MRNKLMTAVLCSALLLGIGIVAPIHTGAPPGCPLTPFPQTHCGPYQQPTLPSNPLELALSIPSGTGAEEPVYPSCWANSTNAGGNSSSYWFSIQNYCASEWDTTFANVDIVLQEQYCTSIDPNTGYCYQGAWKNYTAGDNGGYYECYTRSNPANCPPSGTFTDHHPAHETYMRVSGGVSALFVPDYDTRSYSPIWGYVFV
jgi:hypothetical protein